MNKSLLYSIKVIVFLTLIAVVIVSFSIAGIFVNKKSIKTFSDSDLYPVIIIDAGHGGEDGGAEANGVVEKNINLNIAKSLSAFLKASAIENVMTRTDDVLLYKPGEENNKKRHDILNRVSIAEKYDNAVFVSIHQNKFEIPKYKGLQVYYSQNNRGSEMLAKIIQTNSKNNLDIENYREVKPADFRIKVLDMLEMPAVLVECGFLSNPAEAKLLNDTGYQNKIAFNIYLSLIEYLENNGA